MLSHLRFHRRGGASNPASPSAEQHPLPSSNANSPFTPHVVSFPDSQPPPSTTTSPAPPVLPPIIRVTSSDSPPLVDFSSDALATIAEQRITQPGRLHQTNNLGLGFIGGVALNKHQPDPLSQNTLVKPESRNLPLHDNQQHHTKLDPVTSAQNAALRPMVHRQGFTKISSQSSNSSSAGPTDTYTLPIGRRIPSRSTNTERVLSSSSSATLTSMEPQKSKRGLPFLKNPVSSLLMRRKINQNVPESLSLSVAVENSEPTYDPRIKGTRVHDFSAPRRQSVPQNEHKQLSPLPESRDDQKVPAPVTLPEPANELSGSHGLIGLPVRTQSSLPELDSDNRKDPCNDRMRNSYSSTSSGSSQFDDASNITVHSARHGSSSFRQVSPSAQKTYSRKDSVSEMSSKGPSAHLPRHSKSTSSRFSFDMIGAAKQEKLLEERHRQRQLEKVSPELGGKRDSRFDEIDDNDFDYDAMLDDDDLEEKIPGVNADLDDDEYLHQTSNIREDEYDEQDDPANDQENFAGFVFQRSIPSSTLASPFMPEQLPTPRDAQGQAIGSALTKDTPTAGTFPPLVQGDTININPEFTQNLAGLGDHDRSLREATMESNSGPLNSALGDEMYFDDGQVGYENEFSEDLAAECDPSSEPFDESIFDNDDTDQFGRPVPGAFARAQSQRQAARQSNKYESDMICHSSAQPSLSWSTARTSFSSGGVPNGAPSNHKISPLGRGPSLARQSSSHRTMLAYQAALADAAHEAAASGKFNRNSSPIPEDDVDDQYTLQSHRSYGVREPTSRTQDEAQYLSSTSDYISAADDGILNADGEDYHYENMDDFELDEDAIIAEANASALANDSDGFYGQEFGFYAAPSNQHHGSHGSHKSSNTEYSYSNGGFFGPKGDLARSTSDRLVSREPNLTPITERSEYSNRNSLMSMGLPPMVGGTPTMQSPGLAQLALMSDQGDEMSLSALRRLRFKAWGGSQVSLVSSHEGSPKSERAELPSSPWTGSSNSVSAVPGASFVRQNSLLSTEGFESDVGSQPVSPRVMAGNSSMVSPPPPQLQARALAAGLQQGIPVRGNLVPFANSVPRPLATNNSESVPVSAAQGKIFRESTLWQDTVGQPVCAVPLPQNGQGHRRQQKSTDSISYIKEEEGDGEAHWIMERRRIGQDDELQLLEREIISGGRI